MGADADGNTPPGPSASDITGKVLDFLSDATTESLCTCFAILSILTYLILGRIGLVLIGVFGGVVLHATYESVNGSAEQKETEIRRRRDVGLDVARRLLDWQLNKEKGEVFQEAGGTQDIAVRLASRQELNFDGFRPATAAALAGLVDAAIGNYVKGWYAIIIPTEESFPSACRQTLTAFVLAVSYHLSRKRPADTFLNFLTNATSILIVFLSELSRALMDPERAGAEAEEAIPLYLEQNPESNLANILNAQEQKKKLGAVADDILQTFLDSKAYNYEPVKVFLREILAGVVFRSILTTCSKPEWINGWIIYLLEQEEPGILDAIDAGVEGISSTAAANGPAPQRQGPKVEGASDDGTLEIQNLNAIIATEDARNDRKSDDATSSTISTNVQITPTSSQDDFFEAGDVDVQRREPYTPEDMGSVGPEEGAPSTTFTSFDQIVPKLNPAPAPLTLHNAKVGILDDAQAGDKSSIRSRPTVDYLLQIEPASSQHAGWMIVRKYADFETLHEVLRRISAVSGVTGLKYDALPGWKGRTKDALRVELEAYLADVLSHAGLAESEGMKRFLEKDQTMGKPSGSGRGLLGFPSPEAFHNMGKGMLDVLASAPMGAAKGAADGGKALFEGVTGVFAPKKIGPGRPKGGKRSVSEVNILYTVADDYSPSVISQEAFQPLPRISSESVSSSVGKARQEDGGLAIEPWDIPDTRRVRVEESLHLPPPPSEMKDDYDLVAGPPDRSVPPIELVARAGPSPPQEVPRAAAVSSVPPPEPPLPQPTKLKTTDLSPLTEEEARVAVELFFATINELYTLSSAWSLRRTLLNAAKAFLVRPGNPNLEAIRAIVQETAIDANATDAGLARKVRKVRESALPTPEELAAWPPPPSKEEKERLRAKARTLLVTRGMPQALTSVMGAAASGEALGRVFDSLQVEEVARGLFYALLLQGIRAVAH